MDKEIIDWIEQQSTLHKQVDILYVVNGYQIALLYDCDPIDGKQWFGETLREAFVKAMSDG